MNPSLIKTTEIHGKCGRAIDEAAGPQHVDESLWWDDSFAYHPNEEEDLTRVEIFWQQAKFQYDPWGLM